MSSMNIVNERGAFDIRPANVGDLDYILNAWQLTWNRSPEVDWPNKIQDEYFRIAHALLDEIISRSAQQGALYVCHFPGSPHIIRGFLCGEVTTRPDVAYIHWIQVKKAEWRKGVASALLERFKLDFDVHPEQNLLYTFATNCLKQKHMRDKVLPRHNFLPWLHYKYTSQPWGWETGQERPCPHCGGHL